MISRNIAKCRACGDVVESRHRHDWKQCFCGEMFVDGGKDYLRRGYGKKGYIELSTWGPCKHEPKEYICIWCGSYVCRGCFDEGGPDACDECSPTKKGGRR